MLLLLLDPTKCPACNRRTVRRDVRKCISCEAKLFWMGDSFSTLKAEWIISYWLFTKDNGWVYSSHLENPQPILKPIELTPPPLDYGTKPIPT